MDIEDMNTEKISLPARDSEHERVIGIVFDIPPQQAALVSCLSTGAVAKTEQLYEHLECKTHPKIIISHARARLREFGMDIRSKWNVGYWMDEETRAAIDAKVKAFFGER